MEQYLLDLSMKLKGAIFTSFDTETTGLNPDKGDRIIEIGGISFDRSGIRSRFNSLINPGIPVPEKATEINGITNKMLEKAPGTSKVIQDFCAFTGNSILLAYNAGFDIAFLKTELQRIKYEYKIKEYYDILKVVRDVFPGEPSYKLQVIAPKLGIQAKNAHRAEDDARVAMEVFLKAMEVVNKEQVLQEKNPSLIQ